MMAGSTLVAEHLAPTDQVPQRDCSAPVSRKGALRYWVAVFLSAFLLFQVQLIVGKYILPLFGGAPAVWNTCMLCFQFLLLAGYSYAHILRLKFNPQVQGRIHSALLLFAVVVVAVLWAVWGSPLTPGASWRPSPEDNPVWKILQLLLATVALPFFVLSATGPLLQNWYRYEGDGSSPYRLYAISNAGSLIGLLSYPFLIEWVFTIRHQAWVWACGFAGFAILCAATGWKLTNRSDASLAAGDEELKVGEKPRASRYALWIGLSACSTTMLLAATNLICQDMAVIPLLWVVPLCIYLGTFILAFGKRRWYRRSVFWPLYFLALGVELKTNLFGHHLQSVLQIFFLGVALFVVCMVCHGELSLSRPAPRFLTSFYLMIAGGGVAGGIFVVLIAPRWFVGFWEFQVALVACGLLLFVAYRLSDPGGQTDNNIWTVALLIEATFLITNIPDVFPAIANIQLLARPEVVGAAVGSIGAMFWLFSARWKKLSSATKFAWRPIAAVVLTATFGVLVCVYARVQASEVLYQERNFYGIKSVVNEKEHIALLSGSTLHGRQFKMAAVRDVPLTYFRTESGIGLLLTNYPRGNSGGLRVGIVGMGAGTLAAYGRHGDYYRFYEIDPAMVDLSAGNPFYFSFVRDSKAKIDAVLGDARISLEKELSQGQSQHFDVLVLDAFSSDSIPVHLLTNEAMNVYLAHLRDSHSVMAVHITNRFVGLAPVVVALANSHQLASIQVRNMGSTWILLSADPEMLRLPGLSEKSTPVPLTRGPVLWTDDYSNLFQVVHRPVEANSAAVAAAQ
jgi:hypothetical protein